LKKKKLLLLGGLDVQIPFILKAQELGYFVITIDNIPNNAAHFHSDQYHNIDITDLRLVLALAIKLNISGISSYACEAGALTSAYVSEKLRLSDNRYKSMEYLSDKVLFRNLQNELSLPHPKFTNAFNLLDALNFIDSTKGKFIVKPVDSSGSKGITKLNNNNPDTLISAIKKAKSYSKRNKIIIEQYIDRVGTIISGDCFIQNGKVNLFCFGDVYFNDRLNGLVPRSIALPSSHSKDVINSVIDQLNIILDKLIIINGVFNLDVLVTKSGKGIILDIGTRNGGNLFNDIISLHTNVDIIKLTIEQTMGNKNVFCNDVHCKGFFAHNVLHSEKDGIFNGIIFSKIIEPLIISKFITKRIGESIFKFNDSSDRIGVIILKFSSKTQMNKLLNNIHQHIRIIT